MTMLISAVDSTENLFNHHQNSKEDNQSTYGYSINLSLAKCNYDLDKILPNSWKITPVSLDDSPNTDDQNIIFNNKNNGMGNDNGNDNNNQSDNTKNNNNKSSNNNNNKINNNNNDNNAGRNHPSISTSGNQMTNNQASPIIVGPCGFPIGISFDMKMGSVQSLVKMKVYHDSTINAIQVIYRCHDGQEILSPLWGAQRGKLAEIPLQQSEFFTAISGHCGLHDATYALKSLTFVSNLRIYGPFGSEEGSTFSLPAANSKIIGLHGYYGHCVNSIGIYIQLDGISSIVDDTSRNKIESVAGGGSTANKQSDAKDTTKPHDNAGTSSQNKNDTTKPNEVMFTKLIKIKKIEPLYKQKFGSQFDFCIKNNTIPKLVKIVIHHGMVVDSIQVTFQHGGQLVTSPKWGGNGGNRNEINLDPNEHVSKIDYLCREYRGEMAIRYISFHTNRRVYEKYGDLANAAVTHSHSMLVGEGNIIVGFYGSYGKYLSNLGVHYASAALW